MLRASVMLHDVLTSGEKRQQGEGAGERDWEEGVVEKKVGVASLALVQVRC